MKLTRNPNTKLIVLIPFDDIDIKFIKDFKMIKKLNMLFYAYDVEIYLSENMPEEPKSYKIYISDKDLASIQNGDIVVKPYEDNLEYRLMNKSVYDKMPKEEHDKEWYENKEYLNAKELTVTFGQTKAYIGIPKDKTREDGKECNVTFAGEFCIKYGPSNETKKGGAKNE